MLWSCHDLFKCPANKGDPIAKDWLHQLRVNYTSSSRADQTEIGLGWTQYKNRKGKFSSSII